MESAGRYITRTIMFGMTEDPSRLLEAAFAQLDREGYRVVTVCQTGNIGRSFRWFGPALFAVILITLLATAVPHLTGLAPNDHPSLFDAIPVLLLPILFAPLLLGKGLKLSLLVIGERMAS
jgi:hypothetical protein